MDTQILRLINSSKIFGMAWNWKGGAKVKPYPVIFQKPVSSIILSGESVVIPQDATVIHESKRYLVELGFYIAQKAKNVKKNEAFEYVKGYCLLLDMTSPTLLTTAKENGLGWDIGKGYDTFLPISSFIPKNHIKNPHNIDLELKVNNEIKQKGNTKDMCFGIPEIIEYISSIFTLNEGDLIMSGTPSGASPVFPGDILHASMLESGSLIQQLSASIISNSQIATK